MTDDREPEPSTTATPSGRSTAAAAQNRGSPSHPIGSVSNALLLLLMTRDRERLRVSEVAEELDVARSTAHRLLKMLEHYGFLHRDPSTRTYVPGDALVTLGLAAVSRMDLRREARPYLQALVDEVNETAVLVRLEGRNVRFLDAIETPRALRVSGRVGLALPAHRTSVGKAILAAMDADQFAEVYDHTVAPLPADWNEAALRAELDVIRNDGYATAHSEDDLEIDAIGVALTPVHDRTRAGLAIAVPTSRLTPRLTSEYVAALRRTADVFSSALTTVHRSNTTRR